MAPLLLHQFAAAADNSTSGASGASAEPPLSTPHGAILAILRAQEAAFIQLLELANERRASLVRADVDRFSGLSEREHELLARLKKLESARLLAVRPLAQHAGLPPERITVSMICDFVDSSTGQLLEVAKTRLLRAMDALGRANRGNAEFLQACLDSVNASVEHLLLAVQLDPRYASNGVRTGADAPSPRLTDFKA